MSFHSKQRSSGKGSRWLRAVRWILLVLLLLVLAAGVSLVIFINGTLNKIPRLDPTETYIPPVQADLMTEEPEDIDPDVPEVAPEAVTWPSQPEEDEGEEVILLGQEDEILNILLVGQDREPGEGRQRSDSMILVSIHKEKQTVHMISFMRDTYIQIPGGYQDNRLNVPFRYGGPSLLNEALALNFGIYIDHNVVVDFSGFTKIIEKLGGVDIELSEGEAMYINATGGSVTPGMNRLDGAEALCYARIRKLDSEFGRTSRQRTLLRSVLYSLKGITLEEAYELAEEFLPLVSTDMTNAQILKCVADVFPMFAKGLDLENNSFAMPHKGLYYSATIRGKAVFVPDLEACRAYLEEQLR